jgi:ribose transport system ATP-binding protein
VRLGLATAALIGIGGLIEPSTVTRGAILSMAPFISVLALASIGQHLVMQQRGFDLSAAGAMSLGAVLVTVLPGAEGSIGSTLEAIGLTLLAGAACGAANGAAITMFRMPPLVATLGTNALMVALAIWASGGSPHMASSALSGFAQGHFGVVPNTAIAMVVVVALAVFVLHRTLAGRRYAAVGANAAAARIIGVPVELTLAMTYTAAGLCYAFAAIMLAGVVESPSVTAGNPYILSTVAAVAVGGNATLERRASLVATAIGAVLLTYLGALVVAIGFDKAAQYIVQALVIVASIGLPDLARAFATPRATTSAPARAAAAAGILPKKAAFTLTNIGKSFGSVAALRDVSLEILPAEVHAIVGENGAGKSTLIAIAAGVLKADFGAVIADGMKIEAASPASLRDRGVAVVYQHPALAPDLSVLENLRLFMGSQARGFGSAEARALIAEIALEHLRMDVGQRVSELSTAQRHIVEIARALSISPRIVFFDEPTEPLQKEDVAKLFEVISRLKTTGVAVVYVSHRLHEVMALADRVSVLRDGELIDTRQRSEITTKEIVTLIAGRPLEEVFPPKGAAAGAPVMELHGLGGSGFANVSLAARQGEIVGLTGVEGQGQREVLRAMAGAVRHDRGDIRVSGAVIGPGPTGARRAGIGFIPDDRHREGLFLNLSIRENIGFTAPSAYACAGLINPAKERQVARTLAQKLDVKAPSVETIVSNLSGGNQQKILFARELMNTPRVLLVDEPTRGIDIGTRSGIYHRLREISNSGVGVVISSSDGTEVEGLCDRVLIFSRGHVIRELTGAEVVDETITEANMSGANSREAGSSLSSRSAGVKWLGGDHMPGVVLAVLGAAIAMGVNLANPYFLTPFSISNMLTLSAILAFVSAGQLCAIIVGGIDLAVGPLAGLGVVLASFLLTPDESWLNLALGCAAIVAFAVLYGLLQGLLIVGLRIPAVVVTLASFIGLQGVSLILRPNAGGMIDSNLSDTVTFNFGPIPLGMILTVTAFLALQGVLSWAQFGRMLRAVGSDAGCARKLGVVSARTVVLAFGLSGALTGIGALMLAGQVGIGSPTTGVDLTLMSITAVVLGGASIAGGRGSFFGTLVGCFLLQLLLSAATFLQAGPAWQYALIGGATLAAAALFSVVRPRAV